MPSIKITQNQSLSSYNHMLCMSTLILIILCHFHGEANFVVGNLPSLLGVITMFLLYTWGQPYGMRLVIATGGHHVVFHNVWGQPRDRRVVIAIGGRHFVSHYAWGQPYGGYHVVSRYAWASSMVVRPYSITTKVEPCFRFIAYAMFMLMLTKPWTHIIS